MKKTNPKGNMPRRKPTRETFKQKNKARLVIKFVEKYKKSTKDAIEVVRELDIKNRGNIIPIKKKGEKK